MTATDTGCLINQYLLDNEKRLGDRIYLRQPRDDQWHEYTWQQTMRQARQVARFLQDTGLNPGDRVAIFSKNCAEWFISDFGISLAGMVSVPLFANQHKESIDFVLNHAGVKVVFIGKLDNHKKTREYISNQFTCVSFNYHPNLSNCISWDEILKKEPLQEVVLPQPEDLFTIIYSSGTTGLPKGSVYTHEIIGNYLALFPDDLARVRKLNHYHLVSYLPLAHVYERTAIELGSVSIPCDVSFIESLDKFAENLREIRPSLFTAVPRIWGVFQQKIEQKASPEKLRLILKIPILSYFIKKKIRRQLGLERCYNCFSGASHLPASIIKFFDDLNIPIQEGYGQTENLAYATLSELSERRPGYVGSPRLKVEVKLGENEELLIKSPCLMKEYYDDPEATVRSLTTDGWLCTGDIAEIDNSLRVKILGRLSENFKNQKGEFIAPGPIEERFSESCFIEQLCLVGRELPSNVLIITLNETGQQKPQEWIKEQLEKILHSVNTDLASYEKISHILISKYPWTPENGCLTPTLKIKRRTIEANYQPLIKRAIKERQSVIWE
ncbi:AMP-binding protein [Legionella quinlivanii]|uniref:AMP-binding protein n=1 Tax=Legionella quinlivanii TaxID=45073 RepID=UPI002243B34E|nr:AMP-binding protein [Legionella quinlivanii]MCW8451050.1 AMP-binding protein [Legionella quinlivanii]